MRPLRAAIIGGGWIARRHVPAIDAALDVELVAACDVDRARAAQVAEPRGARAYERWETMLEHETLDLVWVCTPPLLHRAPTVAALERGIHVYLEKPIARTIDDAEAIVAAAAHSDAICMIGYQWHATELLDEIRDAIRGQALGMLIGRNYGPVAGRPWFLDQAQGGGQILERGSHHIDLQRAIAGEIESVQAISGPVRLARAGNTTAGIDDVLSLVFHFRSGSLGFVHIAWSAEDQPELYSLDVLAGESSLWVELGPQDFALRGLSRGVELHSRHDDPFGRSVERFLEVARTVDRGLVFCTPADALRTLEVALACERALAERSTVSVVSSPE